MPSQRRTPSYALPEPLVEVDAAAGAAGAAGALAEVLPESPPEVLAALSDELADAPPSVLAGAAASPPGAALALAPLLLLPPRKSVTYQPEPFNWNPAAVTCLRKVSFPHSGQFVNGASLIF